MYLLTSLISCFNFAEKPGAPYNLRVIEARARSVLLDFTPGSSGRAPILTYTIQYNNDSFYPVSVQWKTLMVVQDAHLVWNLLPLTLPNLKPYSDYRFRVIAKNKVGSSNPSNASDTVRTLETGKKMTTEAWQNASLLVHVNAQTKRLCFCYNYPHSCAYAGIEGPWCYACI